MQYMVAKGKSIAFPAKDSGVIEDTGHLVKGGTILTKKMLSAFSKGELDRKIRDGFVVAVGARAPEPEAAGTVPGRSVDEDAIDASRAPVILAGSPKGVQTSVAPLDKGNDKKPPESDPSPWVIDPSTLKGKPLEELLVMILEREPGFDPASITEAKEAAEYLSQDFKPKTD